jgi:ribosomal protein S18 acetylase RimI-like enzyme
MSEGHIEIRPLKKTELRDMIAVWKAAGLPYRPSGRDSFKNLERQWSAASDLFIGAFMSGRLVGVAIASDDGRKGWVNRLAVIPAWRRRGVGRAIVEECERVLRSKGRGVVGALIEGENEASEGLFESSGYKLEEDIKYYAKRDSDRT